jgi:hypothetical protein
VRLELIPLILGILVALFGGALVVDSFTEDGTFVPVERRRRARAPRHPRGELLIGLGVLALAAALLGRDAWRWGTVSVIAGLLLVTAGSLLNRHFIAELFSNRGALSRTDEGIRPGAETRTERVVRRAMRPDAGAVPASPSDVAGPPGAAGTSATPDVPVTPHSPLPPPSPERRTTPRGGDGPRRIR